MVEFIQLMYVFLSQDHRVCKFAEEQAEKFGVRAPMVGHMGDGNFHVILPLIQKIKVIKKLGLLMTH